ncbi:MAG: hypothetical protein ACYC61_23420 [Isosphaeraceae bacterium]
MFSSSNGPPAEPHDPTRRLRYDDDLSAIVDRPYAQGTRRTTVENTMMPAHSPGHSGRAFVTLAAIAVLVLWGGLYLGFREWRARYRQRAEYGAAQVAPAIGPLAVSTPPGVDPASWRDAVARTQAMLLTVTASNLLGLDDLRGLGDEIRGAVARAQARPETAVAELAAIWDDMSERGEFLLRDLRPLKADRHPRPSILPSYGDDRVAPALDPLDRLEPPGVDLASWRDAVRGTRGLLHRVTANRSVTTMRMKALRQALDRSVAHAIARPDSAVDELAGIWELLERNDPAPPMSSAGDETHPARPAILAPRR